jgi:pyruvate-formate lyase-activating enzyme
MPSKTLLVDWKGDCFLCECEAWLPISVGQITDFESLYDLWQHPTAQELQQDIDEKIFTHCAVETCGVMDRDIVKTVYTVSINIDESCNLSCPSCRTQQIMITSGPEYQNKLAQVNHIVNLLEKFDQPTRIIMSGNGDVLASSIMRPLLHKFKPRTDHKIKLFTNGLLLRKQLKNNPVLNFVDDYLLSIDAGSAEVYEKVRQGGKWSVLLDNLAFLKDDVQPLGANISLTFVVQAANYYDMENFVKVCIDHKFNGGFTQLQDWGTWANFQAENVLGNTTHPLHNAAKQTLKNIWAQYQDKISFDSSLLRIVQS